jgi:hypothetical protein
MSLRDAIVGTLWAALWFSWVGLLIALLPSLCVGLVLRTRNLANEGSVGRKIPYASLGLVGGLMGEFTAVSSLSLGTWWWCLKGSQVCHDGQAGMVLIFTVPALSFFCSVLSLLWTWASLRIPSNNPFASVFRYSGSNRLLNWTCAIAIQLLFWPLLTIVVFRLTL